MELLYAIPPTHMAMLVYLALESGAGRPRDLVSHIEVEALATAKGYDEMMGVLDDEYIREDYVKADEVSQVYERMRRDAGTTMKDYLLNLGRAKHMLEKKTKAPQSRISVTPDTCCGEVVFPPSNSDRR